ncbi:hypothetical protein [uncultured Campylobacter sp.]|uniref:hypothetical protein n=1 Tax=uncultured Campylobacter sp. TaxID=218934 RepID=UPI00263244FB|nr:hypothetical protein [uncultured Campylobacter sp.]
MFINTSLNSSTYTQTNKSSNSSFDNKEFLSEFIEVSKSTENNLDFMNLGKVSKDEFLNAIDTIKSKMQEVIENVKKDGKEDLAAKLTHIKDFMYQGNLNGYNDTLKELEYSSENLNSKDKNLIAQSADDVLKNFSVSNMLLGGLADIAQTFFQMAGISDEKITDEINKIRKYAFDSEVKLDNNNIIKAENGYINIYSSLSSKYINIFQEQKNSLLEGLLKISD